MYVTPNFKTKKALKEAVAKGDEVRIFSPGPYPPPHNGEAFIEGPHAPEPHSWYANVKVKDGRVTKIL